MKIYTMKSWCDYTFTISYNDNIDMFVKSFILEKIFKNISQVLFSQWNDDVLLHLLYHDIYNEMMTCFYIYFIIIYTMKWWCDYTFIIPYNDNVDIFDQIVFSKNVFSRVSSRIFS